MTTTARACRRIWTDTRNWLAGSGMSPSQGRSSLPQHAPVPLTGIQTSQSSPPPQDPLLLLSCMRKGKGKRLFQDSVKQVSNDQELIHFLKDIYNNHRITYRSIFSLRDVQYLNLVKVSRCGVLCNDRKLYLERLALCTNEDKALRSALTFP